MQIQKKVEQSTAGKTIITFLSGVFWGMIVWLAANIVFAAVTTAIDCSDFILNVLAVIGLAAGGFTAGAVTAKKVGKKGMAVGLASGGILAVLLLIAGVICGGMTWMLGIKLLVVLFLSVCGGIFGVNRKKHH